MEREERSLGGSGSSKLPSRLAAQIIERTRHLGLSAGAHLKEQELADALRVSRTPVRLALNVLASMDLIENRPNRGFFLKHPAEPQRGVPGLKPAPDGAAEDLLYLQISDDRLTGRIPVRVLETEVARRYGATRARIARIFARMAEEGWLTRLPGHGWEFQATLTSPSAYDQSYQFRMLIEPAALREAEYRLGPSAIEESRTRQKAMLEGGIEHWSRSETFAANAGFHETIVSGSNNPFLLEALRRVNRLRRLLEYRMHRNRARLVQECQEHLTLLDLIEKGDTSAAADFLYVHLARARVEKVGIAAVAEKLTEEAPPPDQKRRYGAKRMPPIG
ncbi:GntR family transcriptional regulator (plasmid) [Lichenicola cladoniae]|uniref:GntR family transcriptional regulator n=1 Tax=Lichenicola cladoniae TaxID=1484109 RepID=A0A6M8HXI8_9PROT|nr:GntR family transcriptional regulator [Lichenicola cladoniae]QKE93102.1 GntR family transcriptional regulator [Lichenicola cladoniae]